MTTDTPHYRRTHTLPAGYVPPRLYTTGHIAQITGSAPRTVCKWIDRGDLRGIRLPDSRDRRVSEPDLIAFLVAKGYDLPPALTPKETLAFGFEVPMGVDLIRCADAFDFGAALATYRVAGALVGDDHGRAQAIRACELVRERHPTAGVLLMLSEDAGDVVALPGVVVLRKPLEWAAVAEHLGTTAGVSK